MTEEAPEVVRKGRARSQVKSAAGAVANPKRAEARAKRAADTADKPNRADGRTKPKADVTAHELILMVSRIATDFESLLKTKTPALSLSQWAMIEVLAKEDGASRPSQVARKLGFSRQLVRQATKKLLALELVTEEAPPEGKKAVGISLTDAGRKAITDIAASTDALAATLKEDKRGGGINQAVRTLKGLSAAMPKEPNPAKGRKKKAAAEPAAA